MLSAVVCVLSTQGAEQVSKGPCLRDRDDVQGTPVRTQARVSAHKAQDICSMTSINACVERNLLPYLNWQIPGNARSTLS
jgi:hypothetical protein